MSNGPLDWRDIRESAARFSIKYKNASKEASLKQPFWIDFMAIFGVNATEAGVFEYHVTAMGDRWGEIDYFWPGKVVIEHKSRGKDLDAAMDQAMRYVRWLIDHNLDHPADAIPLPRYVIVSDFKRIRIKDLPENTDDTIQLEELADNVERFGFLAGYVNKRIEGQHPVNVKAAATMGELYDMLKAAGYPQEYLDAYLIRLVFILFAEDAEIFDKNYVTEYLKMRTGEDGTHFGDEIDSIFDVLSTPTDRRMSNLPDSLASFPYVNGHLFSDRIPKATFDRKMRECFFKASELDWKCISPAIFGSLFQCIMDPAKRRELGAHYTSEENILKVIDPLFMDSLRAEFQTVKKNKKALQTFWNKIQNIRILDPACGCGNFLIVSYRELRLLEMDVIEAIGETAGFNTKKNTTKGSQFILTESALSVKNFYGIEIGRFPALIANTAMLLMDHLMDLEARSRFGHSDDIIPIKETASIVCGNSLRTDWGKIVDPKYLTYIVGNPPFVGSKLMDASQKEEITALIKVKGGTLDYVTGWYVKAANMMDRNPQIRTAFVSTNSITQGEQVEPLWKSIFERGFRINFAHRTFKWSNEARGVAAVHVVIIGFSRQEVPCTIYYLDSEGNPVSKKVGRINAYLLEGPDVYLPNRTKPLCDVPRMETGCQPIDDRNYLFTPEQKDEFIRNEPRSEQFFFRYLGSSEFINDIPRFCLYLSNCPPDTLRTMPRVLQRVDAVRTFRLKSKRKDTLGCADTPSRFYLDNVPKSRFILIPETSSEARQYIPMGFMSPDVICSNAVRMVPDATIYHFGILTSSMHMAWMRYVCGRMKSDYRYSAGIVYNNYPWPSPSPAQIDRISQAAQGVLDARAAHPGQTFASLYDPLTMPPDLLKAHKKLDREVEKAYRSEPFADDADRMAFLFALYGKMTDDIV